jgi:hypothetical protein
VIRKGADCLTGNLLYLHSSTILLTMLDFVCLSLCLVYVFVQIERASSFCFVFSCNWSQWLKLCNYFGCFTSLNTEMIPENIFGMFFEVRLCLIDDAYIGFE